MQKPSFDCFYRYDELVDYLHAAVDEKPKLMKLDTLAQTPQGRYVYVATVTDFGKGDPDQKSAYYVQANVHANEGAGTMAALDLLHTLLFDHDMHSILEHTTFYIIPRVNPDGAEMALTTHAPIRSAYEPYDRTNGLIPEDINGDGAILSMRWLDPAGPYKEDEQDPRLMVKREPGDSGPFYQMHTEGVFNEYNGTQIRPGVCNIDFNRNFAVGWEVMDNSGAYPFSQPETRAVADFMLSHPNIFAGVDLHCGTQAILRPSSKPDSQLVRQDLNTILQIGKMAERMTGFPLMRSADYRQPWVPPIELKGNSKEWSYAKLGISQYVVELGWGFSSAGIDSEESFQADDKTRETELMRKVMQYHDRKNNTVFSSWEETEHPQLGTVEVGGLMIGNARLMDPNDMETIAPKVTNFMIEHAKYRPTLILCHTCADQVASDVYRIRTTVANIGGFGTQVMAGGGSVETKRPVKVEIVKRDGMEVLNREKCVEIPQLGAAGSDKKLEWFIKSENKEEITIKASHPRAGTVCETIVLPL